MGHGSSRFFWFIEDDHAREFPGAVRLSLHYSQHFAAHRLRIAGVFIGDVTPFECPIASDLHILDLRFVTKRLWPVGFSFPLLVVLVDLGFTYFYRSAGLNANGFVVP